MVAAGWAARYNKDVPRETTGNKKKENISRPERRAGPSEGDIYYEKDHSSFVPVHLRRCCRCCCPDRLRRCSFFCRCLFRSGFQHCGVCSFRRCPVRQCGHRRFYLHEERHRCSDRGLRPTGSGAGITGATDKTLDIGLSSRALKADETGVTGTTVALDGIAIIVNKSSKVEDLTVDQLKQMFTGEITNWSEVGGDDGEIVLIGREAGSGTRDGFESIVDVKDSCKYAQELTATGAVISAVEANPLAIGYASLSAVGDTVKAVTVGGVECSEETVKDGSYEVQRPFVFVTNDSATLSAQAQAFFDFATSADAADLIRTAGAVPVNE